MPSTDKTQWKIDGHLIDITNEGKVYWPEDQITKGDMLRYYQAVAPIMLPYFKNRPVTLRMYPGGIHGVSHYRRDRPERTPTWMRSARYRLETTGESVPLILVDNMAGLLWLANRGAIEMHLWTSRTDDLQHPDQVAFDLDPGEQTTFKDVLRVALALHDVLGDIGLSCYPKTSGGNGLHVYLPLTPVHSFEQVREWAKSVAAEMAAKQPDLVAVAHGATHEGKRVTFDYAQNSIGRNTAAPYTLRARPGAPVSTPLTWDEVKQGKLKPSDFTLSTVPGRVDESGDLFAPVLRGKQELPDVS